MADAPSPSEKTWDQVRAHFDRALELPADQREHFLAQIANPALADEVRSLLRAHDESTGFLATPPAEYLRRAPVPGDRIGRYQILEEIGRGGMGVVYRARRDDEGFVQQVAIKRIDASVVSQEVLKRFRAERQILALLDHPNIARLIDGGTTTDGGPYLVMEYVSGKPLLAYCDDRRLGIEQRLAVFLAICDAVQFAHQRLVVHRDLKSDNILVTEDGSPRLLDFGIAKLLSPEEGVALGTLTLPMNRMLTPDYASPEQIRGEPATVAADIYSLGVVLYELLSGSRPLHFSTRTPEEILRVATQEEPALPSTVAARSPEAALYRGDTTQRLRRRLSGDLDYVILKALEKDPKRRYASVDKLAQDIRAHLAGLPVLARGRSTTYLLSRLVRRHRAAVVTASLVVLALVAGLIATTWQASVAGRERDRANRRFQEVRSLAHAVVFDLHDAIANLPGSTKAREILVQNALRYLDSLSREARDDRSLEHELAIAYSKIGDVQGRPMYPNLGQSDEALKSYDKAMTLLREVSQAQPESVSVTHDRFVVSLRRLDLLYVMGKRREAIDEATAIKQEILAILSKTPDARLFEEDLCVTYGRLVNMKQQAADTLGAIRECTPYLALVEGLYHSDLGNPAYRRGTLISNTLMAQLRASVGDRDSALVFFERAEALAREAAAASSDNTDALRDLSIVYGQHGMFLADGGDIDSALVVYDHGAKITERLAAADPSNALVQADVASSHYEIGTILMKGRRYGAAEERFREAFERYGKLVLADTSNAENRQFMAQSGRGAGEACRALSRQSRSAAERSRWKTAALTWFGQSRDLYRELAKAGALTGGEEKAPDELDGVIAGLRRED
jgi:eukaryotic-like serine/threonine-protein kinase